MSEADGVLVHTQDAVAWVTINRPERSNAIDPETAQRLAEAILRIEADPGVRVSVLTGAGQKAFCAGSDLKAKADGASPSVTDWGFAGFVQAPRTKPVVAAVNGVAAGGGFEIVLACDLVVAVDHAQFFLPEVEVGLVAGGGGLIRLPRRLPPAVACEVVIAGRRLGAQEALGFGLVNRVVPPADLMDAAADLAQRCATGAPLAVRESLAVMKASEGSDVDGLWARSWEASELVAASADGREGPRAFAARRRPVWQGN
jgi:enoyl-CoA hydratase/carnithine racemase